jgi:hypothetical protein
MDNAMTKSEFMTKLTQSRRRWDEAAAGISASDGLKPGFCGVWSLKDLIAHIYWYEAEMLNILRTRNFEGSPLWNLPLEERNAAVQQEVAHFSWAEISGLEPKTYRDLLVEVEKLTDRELNDPSAFTGMPENWIPWEVLEGNTWEHYDDHLSSFREWMESHPKGN